MTKPNRTQIAVIVLLLLITNVVTGFVTRHYSHPASAAVRSATPLSFVSYPSGHTPLVATVVPLNQTVSLTGHISQLPTGTKDYIIVSSSAPNYYMRLRFGNSGINGKAYTTIDNKTHQLNSHEVVGTLSLDNKNGDYYINVQSVN